MRWRWVPARDRPGFLQLGWLLWLLTGSSGCTHFYGKGIQFRIEHRFSASNPQFPRPMSSLVDPVIITSNNVTALINGDQIFPAMVEAVCSAQHSICLETYIYWSGSIGREFAEILAERARAG